MKLKLFPIVLLGALACGKENTPPAPKCYRCEQKLERINRATGARTPVTASDPELGMAVQFAITYEKLCETTLLDKLRNEGDAIVQLNQTFNLRTYYDCTELK